MNNINIEDIEKYLKTPRDLTNESIESQASILTIHFIGFIVKPKGISEDLYKKCLHAFNNNRGKTELEEKAIFDVLIENNNE